MKTLWKTIIILDIEFFGEDFIILKILWVLFFFIVHLSKLIRFGFNTIRYCFFSKKNFMKINIDF